jgi:hypothetical protein
MAMPYGTDGLHADPASATQSTMRTTPSAPITIAYARKRPCRCDAARDVCGRVGDDRDDSATSITQLPSK